MIGKLDHRQTQAFWDVLYSSTALSEAVEWITDQFGPEDIYDEKHLADWALDNGFVKEKP
jgi:hypothetical protein